MRARKKAPTGKPGAFRSAPLPLLLCLLPLLFLCLSVLSKPEEGGAFLRTLLSPRALRTSLSALTIALLSALTALAMGIPAGFLYARSNLPGRGLIRSFFSLPFILPPVLLVVAFTGFYGKAGLLNAVLSPLGLPRFSLLFGLGGIVLAQAFYNFPIVAAMTADALEASDGRLEEAARILGAGKLRRLFTILLPQISGPILASSSLVLLFCIQSFAVLLLMGGGPRYTGFEVEIYRSLRVDFDRGSALAYAFLESALSLGLVLLHARAAGKSVISRLGSPSLRRRPAGGAGAMASISTLSFLAFLSVCVGGPLLALFFQAFSSRAAPGLPRDFGWGNFLSLLPGRGAEGFLPSLKGSLILGLSSALAATAIAASSVLMLERPGGKVPPSLLPILPMAISPMVLALSLRSFLPEFEGFPAILLFQSLIALPFAYQSLRSALDAIPPSMEEAARVLGASRLKSLLGIRLPLLAKPLMSAFAFAFAISLADIAGPLSFGSGEFSTLGLLVYRLSSAYRFDLAAAAGLVLLSLSGLAFFLSEARR